LAQLRDNDEKINLEEDLMAKRSKSGESRKTKGNRSLANGLKKAAERSEKLINRFEKSSRVDEKSLNEPMTI